MTSKSFSMDNSKQIDMSSEAIATRLKRVSQLRRLCLSLGKARVLNDDAIESSNKDRNDEPKDEVDASNNS